MSRSVSLYEKALQNPKGLSFAELCRLAEYAGFHFKRQRGSHRIYKHPDLSSRIQIMTFQESKHSEAKPYQVRQLLDVIDAYHLIKAEER